jgi:2-polyprenyl-6-methoxyphenol hydroxylase-like FAD-dependent oxidoreductase
MLLMTNWSWNPKQQSGLLMYDAVVVGARCAGAATALLLARQGHKVLIVDQAHFPSDVRLSTHLLWHSGVDLLQKWGLLDALRASACPPLTDFYLDMGELVLHGIPPDSQTGAAFAPRRIVLDKLLLDAAVAAGAQLQEGLTLEDVVRDGEQRVTGIRGRLDDGQPFSAQARVVIGADGTHSRVARAVDAPSYNTHPKENGAHNTFSYFSGIPLKGVEFYARPNRMVYAWATHNGQALVGILRPGHEMRPPLAQAGDEFMAELDALTPELAQRVRAAQREDDWVTVAVNTFCRQAAGPGWCLVGDAGLTMDPITAAGITNALRDADLLGDLLHQGLSGQRPLDEALTDYEPRRNAVSVPLHQFAQDMARLAPPTEDAIKLFVALAGNQQQIDRYFGVFAQTVSPADFFSPSNLQAILGASSTALN